MRINIDQLHTHLEKKGLLPSYLITGDEPLQRIEAQDTIRRFAFKDDFSARVVLEVVPGFQWEQLQQATANRSLFSHRQLIELRFMGVKSPGKEGAQILTQYTKQATQDIVLLISMDKLEKKAQQGKWFQALDRLGAIIQVWPIEQKQLPGWIIRRGHQQGKRIDAAAAQLIAGQVEGNLLAARQEIDRLCLLAKTDQIDSNMVMHAITDSSRYNVFELVESAFSGQIGRTSKIIQALKDEGVEIFSIYGAIIWEFRRACLMSYQLKNGKSMEQVLSDFQIWGKRKPATAKLLQRNNSTQLQQLLCQALRLEPAIKSEDRVAIWDRLANFLFRLAGFRGLET